ncbi:MAG TPA: hypothetical protein VIV11_13280 [Kofleriaceae bacterium]
MLGAGCANNQQPHTEDSVTVVTEDTEDAREDEARAITASFDLFFPSCVAPVAQFEAIVRYADDPTSTVPNVRCLFTFEDGSVSTLCAGEHTFPAPGPQGVSLEVEDLDTGEVDIVEETRFIAIPLTVDLALDVPECGLTFSFDADLSTPAETHVTMHPPEQFVDADVFGTSGSFTALEAGVYTLRLFAEDARPDGATCQVAIERTVELVACKDDHEHEPGCGH